MERSVESLSTVKKVILRTRVLVAASGLQEQLGLKLDSAKGPVEVLVIDQVERPSEN